MFASGLTSDEAQRRLERFGPNEAAPPHARGALLEVVALFANPLALVLIVAAVLSALVGERASAALIIVIVLVGAGINAIQTWRSSHAINRLRGQVALTATVQRDGAWCELPVRQLVPGDLIRLSAGDLVPADARLLEARDLYVQQAALTGESLPAEKHAAKDLSDAPLHPADTDAVFLGTSVISGTATALVVATGKRTALGELAARLIERPPETEFDRGTRRFGLFITQTVLVLVFAVLLVNAMLRRDFLESLLFAVALAVGLTPEFLPMITAVTLAKGAVRMARRHVVVKHLAAIQNLGSMDVLCSDKTGTLTRGEMELHHATDPFGRPAERALVLGFLNSVFETGIKSPLDAALVRRRPLDSTTFRKLDEVPFDFERRRLSVLVEEPEGRLLITKGAPESILACCTHHEVDGETSTLDEASRARFLSTYQQMSSAGYRLLAVAFRRLPGDGAEVPTTLSVADEAGLTLVGLLVFVDPLREDAAAALRELHRDGVRVKVLTGDNELVARHVCQQVGLDGHRVVLGKEVERMSDAALGHVAEKASVFARLTPSDKNRVLRALKARGHVVGYIGDGINDAPSLHTADVGISVAGAVDVAKDAADIILLTPGLEVLHRGVREGRQAFGNVMKYLLMGTSSNFGNMLSMAAATAVLPFLPMLPLQILLNSLLYDLAQLTIPTDRVDASFIHKPRRWDIGVIRRFMLAIGPLSSIFDFVTFWALLHLFHANESLFHTGWFVESLATQTLVLFVIRTGGNPLRSRPSRALTTTVLGVVAIGLALPYSPLGPLLGFTPLPAAYLPFLAVATATYLVFVQFAKVHLLRAQSNRTHTHPTS